MYISNYSHRLLVLTIFDIGYISILLTSPCRCVDFFSNNVKDFVATWERNLPMDTTTKIEKRFSIGRDDYCTITKQKTSETQYYFVVWGSIFQSRKNTFDTPSYNNNN